MSYRLINANAIAIKYPEVNDMPCVFADLQGGLHGQFIEERKKGRWINNSPVTMKCDQCGYVIKDWRWNELNFCANCGADMRGESDE